MNPTLKKIISFAAAAAILWIAYYGSYLPFRKSRTYIQTLNSMGSINSFAEFKERFLIPLNMPSPIGQEEIVRNTANMVVNFIQQTNDPSGIDDAINFVETNFRPIIARGRGMSFTQNLYILGAMHELALVKAKDLKYLAPSKNYYLKGYELGQKRPQFLFGLFDIYRAENNIEKTQEVVNQILAQWPNEERIKGAFQEFLDRVLTNQK